MMSLRTLTALSCSELKHAFSSTGTTHASLKAPGSSDFKWLCVFAFTAQLLLMILAGVQTGVINRLIDTFLNSVPDHGVPIWVRENVRLQTEVFGILPETVTELNRSHMVFPFRTIPLTGHAARIKLPGTGVWVSRKDDATTNFVGRGVFASDPLWKASGASRDADLVLNRAIVAPRGQLPRFDLASYRKALRATLPQNVAQASLAPLQSEACPILNGADDRLSGCDVTKLSTVWLEAMRVGRDNTRITELIPLRVHWAEHIVAAEGIGFLLTLPNYHRWHVLNQRPDSHYFHEWDPFYQVELNHILKKAGVAIDAEATGSRVERLSFIDGTSESLVRALAERLGGDAQQQGKDVWTVEFEFPVPVWMVIANAREIGVTNLDWNTLSTVNKLVAVEDGVLAPCTSAIDDQEKKEDEPTCKNSFQLFRWSDKEYGFPDAMIYVKDRKNLFPALKEVEAHKDLRLHEAYRDALTKASYLTMIIDLSAPLIGALAFFIIVLMSIIKIGTVVGHRRCNYGLMLSHGVHISGVYGIVLGQLGLITVAAGACAALSAKLCESLSKFVVRTTSSDFVGRIAGAGQPVIELNGSEAVAVIAAMLLIVVVTASVTLHRNGITSQPRIAGLLPK